MAKVKTSNSSVKPRITSNINKTEGILNYDTDNIYPQRVANILSNSGTGQACADLFSKFIRGGGFKDQTFYKAVINKKGLTTDRLLRSHSKDYSKWRGFAFHFNYNALFEKIEINYIPFEHCRLTIPDDKEYIGKIAVYDDWNKIKKAKIDKKDIDLIDVYNPEADIIMAQVEKAGGWDKYKGQILWYSFEGESTYPKAYYDPVLEDIQTDSQIKTYRLSNVSTSFMASHVIEVPYEFETEQERQEEQDNWSKFQGADNANKIILAENPNTADAPIKITKIDNQNNDKLFEVTNRSTKDAIMEGFGIPPVLLGVAISGKLGTADEIQDAVEFYNSYTSDERLIFEEEYKKAFAGFESVINPSNDFTIIPFEFKQRTVLQKLGPLNLAVLKDILATPMQRDQKLSIIKIVFGFTDNEAMAIVPEDPLKAKVL